MIFPSKPAKRWKRRFALFPVECGEGIVWLTWYWQEDNCVYVTNTIMNMEDYNV